MCVGVIAALFCFTFCFCNGFGKRRGMRRQLHLACWFLDVATQADPMACAFACCGLRIFVSAAYFVFPPPPGTLDILVFILFRMLVYSQILQFVELVCHCDDGLVTNLVIAGFPDPTPFKRKRCGSSHFMNVMMCWL